MFDDQEDAQDEYVCDDGQAVSGYGNDEADFDAQYDAETPIENDGRSKTETSFSPRDAPADKQEKFARLKKMNDGVGDSDRAVQNHHVHKQMDADVFASAVDFTSYQQCRLSHFVEEVDFNQVNRRASSEAITLAFMTLIAREDDWWLRDEPGFQDLVEANHVTASQLRDLRQDIRDSEYYD